MHWYISSKVLSNADNDDRFIKPFLFGFLIFFYIKNLSWLHKCKSFVVLHPMYSKKLLKKIYFRNGFLYYVVPVYEVKKTELRLTKCTIRSKKLFFLSNNEWVRLRNLCWIYSKFVEWKILYRSDETLICFYDKENIRNLTISYYAYWMYCMCGVWFDFICVWRCRWFGSMAFYTRIYFVV